MSTLKVDTQTKRLLAMGCRLQGMLFSIHKQKLAPLQLYLLVNADILTINFTPKFSNSFIHVFCSLFNVRKIIMAELLLG